MGDQRECGPNGRPGETGDWDSTLVQLYEDHYAMLVHSAMRYLDVKPLAEEAVQEAFVRYHVAPNQPAAGRELSFLHSIVLNNARSMLRRRQTSERWRPEMPHHQDSPEEETVRRASASYLRDAVAQLPRRQRQVVELQYLLDYSERETAAFLSISAGSVKQHSYRARQVLRTALDGSDAGFASVS